MRTKERRIIPLDEEPAFATRNGKLSRRTRMPGAGIMKWSSALIVGNSNVDIRLLKKILHDILESTTTCHIEKRFTKPIEAAV